MSAFWRRLELREELRKHPEQSEPAEVPVVPLASPARDANKARPRLLGH